MCTQFVIELRFVKVHSFLIVVDITFFLHSKGLQGDTLKIEKSEKCKKKTSA